MEDNMEKEKISHPKLYELALQNKQHQEDRRDTINSYYISLFSAIIAVLPFISKINEAYDQNGFYIVKLSLITLSLVCLVLSTTWLMNLRRILLYLQAVDEFLMILEKEQDMAFIKSMTKQLDYVNAPERITRAQFVLPYTFMLIFLGVLIHLSWEFFIK
jgi:hypothetical protein